MTKRLLIALFGFFGLVPAFEVERRLRLISQGQDFPPVRPLPLFDGADRRWKSTDALRPVTELPARDLGREYANRYSTRVPRPAKQSEEFKPFMEDAAYYDTPQKEGREKPTTEGRRSTGVLRKACGHKPGPAGAGFV